MMGLLVQKPQFCYLFSQRVTYNTERATRAIVARRQTGI